MATQGGVRKLHNKRHRDYGRRGVANGHIVFSAAEGGHKPLPLDETANPPNVETHEQARKQPTCLGRAGSRRSAGRRLSWRPPAPS